MSETTPSDELLARYCAGDATAEQRAVIDRWAAADPTNQSELKRLRAIWSARKPDHQWDVERAWSRVDARLDEGTTERALFAGPRWRPVMLMQAAAVTIVVVGLAFMWRTRVGLPSGEAQLIATAIGEQRDILLPDSTQVTLAPASSLSIPANYGADERSVELVGEAWFHVRHDAAKAFRVHAATTVTEDIGTVFTVRALAGDTLVRVTVTEGSASLRRARAPGAGGVVLQALETGILTANATSAHKERSPVATTSWREGQLSFDNTSLAEVTTELRRWYRNTILLGDSTLAPRRISATLPARDLQEALEVLRLALLVRIEQRGDTVILR